MEQDKIREIYGQLNDIEKEIFNLGRESVLNDFDAVCLANAFMGFTTEEFNAVKKFFKMNNQLRKEHLN